MEFRVEQLAAACDVTVDTLRYYQSRGLLPAPERRGRIAIYGTEHRDRLAEIRTLQTRGLSLQVIGKVLDGAIDAADVGLAVAVAAAQSDEPALTLDQLAERSGVPAALLRAVEDAGLLLGRDVAGEERYSTEDLEVVRSGLRLLEAGFPLQDLIALAQAYDVAARAAATEAVALFDRHVREPILAATADASVAEQRLVAAFATLLPAVTGLIGHHFRRVLLAVAEEHLARADAVRG